MSVFDSERHGDGRDQPPEREPIEVVAEESERGRDEVVFYHPDSSKKLGEWIAADADAVVQIGQE